MSELHTMNHNIAQKYVKIQLLISKIIIYNLKFFSITLPLLLDKLMPR